MLSLGKFPTQVQYSTLLHNPISQYPQFTSCAHLSFPLHLNFQRKLRAGLCRNASKAKKRGNISEMDGPDEFEEDLDDGFLHLEDDGGQFFEDGAEEDEVVVPLKNMKQWLENRPRGFGEGKMYDTSIEDKLMEEIEQSRKAQLANLNKLKDSSPMAPSSKKEIKKQDKGYTNIEDGFRVRLVNLPKKKNIHKDLKVAFEGVKGIVNIVPVVSGNEKTRDPVCKGLAFVDFKYQDEAERFVQNFTGKSISFGKVQKQIKCELLSSHLPRPASDQSVDKRSSTPLSALIDKRSCTPLSALNSMDNSSSVPPQVETISSELDGEDEGNISEAQFNDDDDDDDGEIEETSTTSTSSLVEVSEIIEESAIKSSPSKQRRKLNNEKKAAPKQRKDKTPKLNIPGSANRLKIREKEMLTGVFSKYGLDSNLAIKEKRR